MWPGVSENSWDQGLGPSGLAGSPAEKVPPWRAEAVGPGAALTCRPGSCTRTGG